MILGDRETVIPEGYETSLGQLVEQTFDTYRRRISVTLASVLRL